MRKILLTLSIFFISMFGLLAQTYVRDSVTQFKVPLAAKSFVYDLQSGKIWQLTNKVLATATLTTSVKTEVTSTKAISSINDSLSSLKVLIEQSGMEISGTLEKDSLLYYDNGSVYKEKLFIPSIGQKNDEKIRIITNTEQTMMTGINYLISNGNDTLIGYGFDGKTVYSTNNGEYLSTFMTNNYDSYDGLIFKGKFISCGNRLSYSTDGVSWTRTVIPVLQYTKLVANSEYVIAYVTLTQTLANSLAYSSDGVNWTFMNGTLYMSDAIVIDDEIYILDYQNGLRRFNTTTKTFEGYGTLGAGYYKLAERDNLVIAFKDDKTTTAISVDKGLTWNTKTTTYDFGHVPTSVAIVGDTIYASNINEPTVYSVDTCATWHVVTELVQNGYAIWHFNLFDGKTLFFLRGTGTPATPHNTDIIAKKNYSTRFKWYEYVNNENVLQSNLLIKENLKQTNILLDSIDIRDARVITNNTNIIVGSALGNWITLDSAVNNYAGRSIASDGLGNVLSIGDTYAFKSSDGGYTWTKTAHTGTPGLISLTYFKGNWVSVGTGKVSYSANGINWSTINVGATSFYRVVCNNDYIVAASNSKIYYSTTGTSWNEVVDSRGSYDLIYTSNKFLLCSPAGGYVYEFLPSNGTFVNVIDNNIASGALAMVGNESLIVVLVNGSKTVSVSTDKGLTFTEHLSNFPTNYNGNGQLYQSAGTPDKLYITWYTGQEAILYESTDGINWSNSLSEDYANYINLYYDKTDLYGVNYNSWHKRNFFKKELGLDKRPVSTAATLWRQDISDSLSLISVTPPNIDQVLTVGNTTTQYINGPGFIQSGSGGSGTGMGFAKNGGTINGMGFSGNGGVVGVNCIGFAYNGGNIIGDNAYGFAIAGGTMDGTGGNPTTGFVDGGYLIGSKGIAINAGKAVNSNVFTIVTQASYANKNTGILLSVLDSVYSTNGSGQWVNSFSGDSNKVVSTVQNSKSFLVNTSNSNITDCNNFVGLNLQNKTYSGLNNTTVIDGSLLLPKLTNTQTDSVLYINNGTITKGLKPAGGVSLFKAGTGTNSITTNTGGNTSTATNSFSIGWLTDATGNWSYSEGNGTNAVGVASHAEGQGTNATGDVSHAEGISTTAEGYPSHAEGQSTTASGVASHAQGYQTIAEGPYTYSTGYYTYAQGTACYTGGGGLPTKQVIALGEYSFNHSQNTAAQTVGNGVLANNSAILGGINHNIQETATNTVVLGGAAINASQPNSVYGDNARFNKYFTTLSTAPASATATGTTGEIRYTATHIYICVATNTWVRAALTTW